MSVIEVAAFSLTDPNGTPLGTVTDAQAELAVRVGYKGDPGSLAIRINRHHSAAALVRENLIYKVKIPQIQSSYLPVGFIARDKGIRLLDPDEKGAEYLELKGVGLKALLKRARLLWNVYAPDQPDRGSDDRAHNLWWWINEPYGAIAVRALEEGINQPGSPLADFTLTFDRVEDSNGDSWANIAEEYQFQVGTDILTVVQQMEEHGDFYLEVTEDLVVNAYQSYTGRNLTGSVHLQAPGNILTAVDRRADAEPALTHLLLEDSDGNYSEEVVPGFSGRANWGYWKAPTNDDTTLNKIAQEVIRASRTALEPVQIGVKPTEVLPGPEGSSGAFWTSDSILLSTDPGTANQDYTADPVLVTGIRLSLTPAAKDDTADHAKRSLQVVVEANVETVRGVDPVSGFGGPMAPHSHQDQLCRPTIPPGDDTPGSEIASAHWDWETDQLDDTDTYSLMDTRHLDPYELSGWWGAGRDESSPRFSTVGVVSVRVQGEFSKQRNSTLSTETFFLQWYADAGDVGIATSTAIGIGPSGSGLGVSALVDETVSAPAGMEQMRVLIPDNTFVNDLTITLLGAPTPGSSGFDGAGISDITGTGGFAAHCDHKHAVLRTTTPGANEDEAHGFPAGTIWYVVDDTDNPTTVIAVYLSLDDTNGAAVWELLSAPRGITISEDGGTPVENVTDVIFDGATVTDDGDGQATVEIPPSLSNPMTTRGDLIRGDAGGPGDPERLAVGTAGYVLRSDGTDPAWAAQRATINFIIDGGGATLTTGVKGFIVIDFACVIESVTMLADQSGSAVVDIWKDTYANYPPVDADSITASAVPTISSATKSQDATLTGWTTTITAGDVLGFNVDSVSSFQRLTVSLKVRRT